jgi:hypothetical protein
MPSCGTKYCLQNLIANSKTEKSFGKKYKEVVIFAVSLKQMKQ